MDLMDLLKTTGGSDSVGQLAKTVGLGSSDTTKLVSALAPALMRGVQKNAADDSGLAGLRKALETGGHDRYIDNPQLLAADETRADGNNILGTSLAARTSVATLPRPRPRKRVSAQAS